LTKIRRPKLGQHFLISETYRRRILEALALRSDDVVLEIGPGRGAMTALLIERVRNVVAVEIDAQLADDLRAQFANDGRLDVTKADILQVDLPEICRSQRVERLFAFGNLPYYITSPILRHLLNSASRLRGMAFVVQREVAERIAAKPGSRAYGYLSVLAQSYAIPRVAFAIPLGAFAPPPAVQSALVTFEMTGPLPASDKYRNCTFLEFAKLGFAQKRKKLSNNLASKYSLAPVREALRQCGFNENVRAEQLSVEQLRQLFECLTPQVPPC
jgi:16S rRNA (adenine1518-N6/adenine1519-N6)-dimethyltransferase